MEEEGLCSSYCSQCHYGPLLLGSITTCPACWRVFCPRCLLNFASNTDLCDDCTAFTSSLTANFVIPKCYSMYCTTKSGLKTCDICPPDRLYCGLCNFQCWKNGRSNLYCRDFHYYVCRQCKTGQRQYMCEHKNKGSRRPCINKVCYKCDVQYVDVHRVPINVCKQHSYLCNLCNQRYPVWLQKCIKLFRVWSHCCEFCYTSRQIALDYLLLKRVNKDVIRMIVRYLINP